MEPPPRLELRIQRYKLRGLPIRPTGAKVGAPGGSCILAAGLQGRCSTPELQGQKLCAPVAFRRRLPNPIATLYTKQNGYLGRLSDFAGPNPGPVTPVAPLSPVSLSSRPPDSGETVSHRALGRRSSGYHPAIFRKATYWACAHWGKNTPKLVEGRGIEPRIPRCKRGVLPLALSPQKFPVCLCRLEASRHALGRLTSASTTCLLRSKPCNGCRGRI